MIDTTNREQIDTWEIEPENPDAPLNRETLERMYFYILNPAESESWGMSLWVEHTGGVEFPVITSGGVGMINSSSTRFGGTPIQPTDEFWQTLVAACDQLRLVPDTWWTVIPENMRVHERWAIESIVDRIQTLEVPYEIDWIIEHAVERVING